MSEKVNVASYPLDPEGKYLVVLTLRDDTGPMTISHTQMLADIWTKHVDRWLRDKDSGNTLFIVKLDSFDLELYKE